MSSPFCKYLRVIAVISRRTFTRTHIGTSSFLPFPEFRNLRGLILTVAIIFGQVSVAKPSAFTLEHRMLSKGRVQFILKGPKGERTLLREYYDLNSLRRIADQAPYQDFGEDRPAILIPIAVSGWTAMTSFAACAESLTDPEATSFEFKFFGSVAVVTAAPVVEWARRSYRNVIRERDRTVIGRALEDDIPLGRVRFQKFLRQLEAALTRESSGYYGYLSDRAAIEVRVPKSYP